MRRCPCKPPPCISTTWRWPRSHAGRRSSTTTTTTSNVDSRRCSVSEWLDGWEWMLADPGSQIHRISVLPRNPPPPADPTRRQGGRRRDRMAAPLPFSFYNDGDSRFGGAGAAAAERGRLAAATAASAFYVVRDDLLHPTVIGNKARKLDALIPILQRSSATDVVTCGGCQSAHAAALAVSCAERGMRSHLLLRGEQPKVSTGYNLISEMYGNTVYVPRALYGRRTKMLLDHAKVVAGGNGSLHWIDDVLLKDSSSCGSSEEIFMHGTESDAKKVVIVSEGAGDAAGLLGVIRLVAHLSQRHLYGKEQRIELVVDAGTGATAIGLAIGAQCLGLPWKITGVMLADTIEKYMEKEASLVLCFNRLHAEKIGPVDVNSSGLVHWVECIHPRKFGRVMDGEIKLCQHIARQTGILLDPIYTLAAWEHACLLSRSSSHGSGGGKDGGDASAKVLMLHTGGTLGMFGVAQRFPCDLHEQHTS